MSEDASEQTTEDNGNIEKVTLDGEYADVIGHLRTVSFIRIGVKILPAYAVAVISQVGRHILSSIGDFLYCIIYLNDFQYFCVIFF